MPSDIKVSRSGATIVVTLARPERLNATGERMREELRDLYGSLRLDREVRAIVITAEGSRAFCVGQDVKEVLDRGAVRPEGDRQSPNMYSPLFHDLWLPCIVAVNGLCAGGGFHFLGDADIVIASREHASFVDPHTSVGQLSVLEATNLFGRVHPGALLKMAVLGRYGPIDAEEALRINLVDEVVPHERLLARACELGELIARNSPAAVEASKRYLVAAARAPYVEQIQFGWERIREHWDHPDVLEGVRAFAEKRPPNWHVDGVTS